jgi:4'-phosphopantetheinyl transferase
MTSGLGDAFSQSVLLELWTLPLAARASAADRLYLSEADWKRAARLLDPEGRAAFIAARSALRRCLGAVTGLTPAAVVIVDRKGGKPDLPDLPHGVEVSFSQTTEMAMVAVCRGARVGVDVDRIQPWDPELATVVLSARERAAIEGKSPEQLSLALTKAWTCKEALLKGLGVGFSLDPRTLTASLGAKPTQGSGSSVELSTWTILTPCVDPKMVAAVAVEAGGRRVEVTTRRLGPL